MSSTGFVQRFAGVSKILTAFIVLALLAALALVVNGSDDKRFITVDFAQVNSVYKGSEVKVLGVPIGKVESLEPRGDVVRVKLSYSGKQRLPSNVKAVVVSPSIVGDRFIQLAPAYGGGPVLKNDAYLGVDRTAVPVELDEIYKSLDDLSLALGPKGANKDGSLSNLIDDTASQLDGEGAQLNETISNFAKLSTTLSDNKDELFGSLREVQDFVSLLKQNDSAVRSFNGSTAAVSKVLAGERQDLADTLKALSLALVDVNSLVKDNRGELRANVKNLTSLSKVLARHEKDIKESVITAPTALSNVSLAYYSKFGTLNTRSNFGELIAGSLADPATFLCNLLGETPQNGALCPTLSGLLGNLPPLPRTAASSATPTPGVENVQDSLGEMLGAQ